MDIVELNEVDYSKTYQVVGVRIEVKELARNTLDRIL